MDKERERGRESEESAKTKTGDMKGENEREKKADKLPVFVSRGRRKKKKIERIECTVLNKGERCSSSAECSK